MNLSNMNKAISNAQGQYILRILLKRRLIGKKLENELAI